VPDALAAAAILYGYYVVALLLIPVAIRAFTSLPPEVPRKFQHVAYAFSVFLLLGLFREWHHAVLASFMLVVVAYPVLMMWERRPSYQRLLNDRTRRGGELRRQMLYVQLTYAVLIAVFWGGLGPGWRPLIAVAVMAWGFGDAAAALVGRFLGRRKIEHHAIDGAKTVEGTSAMVAFAALSVFLTLFFYAGQPWWVSLAAAVFAAPVAAAVELFSRRGLDTLTVPFATAVALVPWLLLGLVLGH
jgi:phytol kinase